MPTAATGLMPVILGSDHAGFDLKSQIGTHLEALGYKVEDVGTYTPAPVDYPDIAAALARSVLASGSRGVLICGSGIGAGIAANKVRGIRAGLAHDSYSAHQGVEHDDMNVLVLGSRVIGVEVAKELVTIFLGARFTGAARHLQRLAKIAALEAKF